MGLGELIHDFILLALAKYLETLIFLQILRAIAVRLLISSFRHDEIWMVFLSIDLNGFTVNYNELCPSLLLIPTITDRLFVTAATILVIA